MRNEQTLLCNGTHSFFILCACSRTTPQPTQPTTMNTSVPIQEIQQPEPISKKNDIKAASVNVSLGIGYLERGDMERARLKLTRALKQDPHSAEANDAMAYFLERTGENQQAEEYYRRAISASHGEGAPQNNYGTFLCRQKKFDEAEQHFKLALQDVTYIKTAEVYENLGLCAVQANRIEAAKQYFEQATIKDPYRQRAWKELFALAKQKNDTALMQKYQKRYTTYFQS